MPIRTQLLIKLVLVVTRAAFADAGKVVPKLIAPANQMEMTDLATYFRWQPLPGVDRFEIQIARDAQFAEVFRSRQTLNQGFHKNCWFPKDLLPEGTFYWRVRAIGDGQPGTWSEVRSVKVNTQHPILREVVRKIGPQTPLFLMRSRTWDPIQHSEHVEEIIPPGLEHVIVVDDLALASEKVMERAAKYEQLGLDFVIWNNRCQVPLSTIEEVFQRFPHCIGTAEGEHFDGITWEKGPEGNLSESDFVHRAWGLCGKYGRFYFFADGDAGSYRWPSFVQRDREYFQKFGHNIVPMFKTTKGDLALHSYGAVQGLMIAGSLRVREERSPHHLADRRNAGHASGRAGL